MSTPYRDSGGKSTNSSICQKWSANRSRYCQRSHGLILSTSVRVLVGLPNLADPMVLQLRRLCYPTSRKQSEYSHSYLLTPTSRQPPHSPNSPFLAAASSMHWLHSGMDAHKYE
jgi:hypothetical protein